MSGASSKERHAWLEDALKACRKLIVSADGAMPENVRASIGQPGRKKAIGLCYHAAASKEGVREIFVSAVLDTSEAVFATLLHECVHASLPDDAKHGPKFKRLALAVGLTGKMTATVAGDELKERIAEWVAKRGEYPAQGILTGAGITKQTTRMLKVCCSDCGYTVRTTRQWLEVSVPACPNDMCGRHGLEMEVV